MPSVCKQHKHFIMEIVNVKGEAREEMGKKATREMRREGKVPCTIYGKDTLEHFSADPLDFKDLIYTPDFRMAELDLDGKKHNCIVKQVQFHPVTEEILHVDLLKLVEGRKVTVQVPLHLRGTPEGVRDGGRLVQTLRKVDIRTVPDKIIAELFVDVSEMDMGDTVRIRDVEVTEDYEVINHPSIPVASVQVPRTIKTLTPEEEEGEELEEGEEPEEGEEGEGEGEEEGKEEAATE